MMATVFCCQVDMNDPEFWTKCVGLTVPVEEEEKLGR